MREFASFESRRTGLEEQGCVPGSEAVSPQVQFAATPRIEVFLTRKECGPNADLPCINGGGEAGEGGGGARGVEGEGGSWGKRFWTQNARCHELRKPRTWREAGISRGIVRPD